jgi:hypothetical protein
MLCGQEHTRKCVEDMMMSDILRCDQCGGESPADGRFCIDCGAPLGSAATGPTTRLAGIACPSCNTNNPENARFCVLCGRGLAATPAQPRAANASPAPKAAVPKPMSRPAPRYSHPRVATPPTLMPMRPAPPVHRQSSQRHDPGAIVFLIGLVVLLANHAIWPGILLLVGFSSLVHQSAHGRPDKGMRALLWLGGLTLLFATGSFWPGIIILFIVNAMIGGRRHSRGWHW